jgi:hypothetical protein
MAGERAKDNKTLTSKCGSCGKDLPAVEMLGLKTVEDGKRTIVSVCKPCHAKGWRPPGYTGF